MDDVTRMKEVGTVEGHQGADRTDADVFDNLEKGARPV